MPPWIAPLSKDWLPPRGADINPLDFAYWYDWDRENSENFALFHGHYDLLEDKEAVLQWLMEWVPSSKNAADAPSRGEQALEKATS
jgi:hypothetical protein